MTPDVSSDLLATVNGSRLFVCNRYTGEVLFETQVDGSPGAGPGLSEKFAYVPMVGGMIVAYRLEPLTDPIKELGKVKKDMTPEEKAAEEADRRENLRLRQEYIPPVFCQSAGRALVQPLVTLQNRQEEFVVWPTDRGIVSFGRIDRRDPTALIVNHELKTDADIVSRPAYLPPDPHVHGDMAVIYAASRDGRVYAILEKSGELLWKFPAAEPVLDSPAVINNRVYICTQLGGMFCLDAKSGKQYWWAPEIMHFVAAGKQRVYASDQAGRTQVLSAKTGARLDILPTEMSPIKLMNTQTDRLYLATDTGLVQCLHEIDLGKPILYGEDASPSRKKSRRNPSQLPSPRPARATKSPSPRPGPSRRAISPRSCPRIKIRRPPTNRSRRPLKTRCPARKRRTKRLSTQPLRELRAKRVVGSVAEQSPINACVAVCQSHPNFPRPPQKDLLLCPLNKDQLDLRRSQHCC